MNDIVKRLDELHKQAIVERSHYYVGKCTQDAKAEITRLRAINSELVAALKALNLAFYGVPFKASPEQMPALKAASEMARAAITAAEKG